VANAVVTTTATWLKHLDLFQQFRSRARRRLEIEKLHIHAVAAMDQRSSLKKSLAKERGVADLPDSVLAEFKELVTAVLTNYLCVGHPTDPKYGLPATKRRNGKGLVLAYEKTGYDATMPGWLTDLLDLWSVRRFKEAAADCIKILLYYPRRSTITSTPGWSASATSAARTTFPFPRDGWLRCPR
jgi:tagatose-1,6-bisphosphate aldolase